MSKGIWFGILVVLLITGVIVYNKVLHPKNKVQAGPAGGPPKALSVEAFVVSPKDLNNDIFASGSLLANEEAELHPEVSGRITMLNIKEGTSVAKGALLVKLYDGDLQAQLNKLQAQKETSEKTINRLQQLLKINGIGQQEYDDATTLLKGIEADMEYTRAQITKTEIRAPFSGKIGLKNVSEGAYVSPATLVATLQQVDVLKVDFTVPEKYSSTIKVGDIFKFSVESHENETFTGKIFAIEPRIDEATRTVKVRGLAQNNKANLFPGSYAKIDLGLKDINNALMIPTQCIIPEARGKKIVVVNNGKADFRAVQTGVRNETYIQITSGATAGDTLVATGMMYVKPGVDIKVTKIIQ